MDSVTEYLKALVEHEDSLVGLGVLAGSSAIEYVFPPFPGDFVALLGAVLVTGYGWSFSAVLGALMLGSLIGAFAAYHAGVVWERRRKVQPRPVLDAIVARFHKHGAVFIIVNRFLPGIRGLIFVAAGLAGVSRTKVLVYAAISALLWNLCLMALGGFLGANLDRLQSFVEQYTAVVWALIILVIVVILVIRWRRKVLAPGSAHDTRPR